MLSRAISAIALFALLGGCMTSGDVASSGDTTTMASADATSAKQIASCEKPLGTVLIADPDMGTVNSLQSMGLQSPAPFLRIMMSQSNCFQVIDPTFANSRRGATAARWIITPNVILSNPDSGGFNAAGLMSSVPGGGFLSSVAGSIHTKEAQTALFVSETKTGKQLAAVQGHAQATDFDASFAGYGRGVNNFGAYNSTPEGKVIMAAYADAFNNLVAKLKGQKLA